MFDVLKTTLMHLSKDKYGEPVKAATVRAGRPTILPPELEEQLIMYCLIMESIFFGLARRDFRRMAVQLAIRNGIRRLFAKNNMAGKVWLDVFLKRPLFVNQQSHNLPELWVLIKQIYLLFGQP